MKVDLKKGSRTGVLLVNVGTPDIPTPNSVRKYLSEFLSDPFVIDLPAWIRYPLVHGFILPKRSFASAALYQLIWSDKGSPLLYHSMRLQESLNQSLGVDYSVKIGMRYGNPSLETALREFEEEDILFIICIPLYPQYSLAATQSAIETIKRLGDHFTLHFVPPFFDSPGFLNSFSRLISDNLLGYEYDKILFSFHGLPKRHVTKLFSSCQVNDACCKTITSDNRNCYRAQCFYSAREIAARLNLGKHQYEVAFQSRLTERWITPYSDKRYQELPREGVKKLAVVCPSFVSDCLETLEEVQIRGQRTFQNFGGDDLKLVPSLNAMPYWVAEVAKMVTTYQPNT